MPERKRLRRSNRLPDGFVFRQEFISVDQERSLIAAISKLPFRPAMYHGFQSRRRIVAFGFDYSFETNRVTPGIPIPDFLLDLRTRITELVPDAAPDDFVEGLVTEYEPGAAIGWHRDAPQFGLVFGLSLASSCRMRLRLATGAEYELSSIELAPRSAYIFRGEARSKWQHSIPAVTHLRYSVTFRTLRSKWQTQAA